MLITEGIDNVMAYELPAGVRESGGYVGSPRETLVKWDSSFPDKLFQVYVNARYAGVTLDSRQRQMLVQLPDCCQAAVQIEVFAVEPEEAHCDFSSELETSGAESGRVKISILRSQELPIGATAEVFFDDGTGQIDFDKPLSNYPIRIWNAWQDKAGFGMSRFGYSDFGREWSAGIGFGKGLFGYGQFGVDADSIEWVSPSMSAGVYKFAVKVTDAKGNESISETVQVTVNPAARPVESVEVLSFDKSENELVLSIS